MPQKIFETLLIKKVMDILYRIIFEYLAFFSKTKSYLNRLVKASENNVRLYEKQTILSWFF